MDEERDRSDLGLPEEWDGLTAEERDEELERLGLKAAQLRRPRRRTPYATAKTRAAAMALAKRSCGWKKPSQSKGLRVRCSRCSAGPATWCRRAGRARPGFLHQERVA